MNEAEFWNIISKIDTKALDRGDDDAAVRPVQIALCCQKDESELAAFEEILAQKLYALDGEIYARNAGESGYSDDGFLYLRLYVVAKGQQYYEAALADPKKMPRSINQWCEALLGPSRSYESGSNEGLWP